MPKNYSVLVPNLKDPSGSAVNVVGKLSDRTVASLSSAGYDVYELEDMVQYRVDKTLKTPQAVYLSFIAQDIARFRIFNRYRYPSYLHVKQSLFGIALTEKEKKIVADVFGDGLQVLDNGTGQVENSSVASSGHPRKLVVISSNFAGVGKTTYAKSLVKELGNADRLAIAEEIRYQLAHVFSESSMDPNAFLGELYNSQKNHPVVYRPDLKPVVLRELICDYSNLMQKHFGDNYWASQAVNTIVNSDVDYIVIDDVRRPTELDHLVEVFGKENIITVYLTKDELEKPPMDATSIQFEGLMDPSTYDIQFNFTADWSNSEELTKLISERLK